MRLRIRQWQAARMRTTRFGLFTWPAEFWVVVGPPEIWEHEVDGSPTRPSYITNCIDPNGDSRMLITSAVVELLPAFTYDTPPSVTLHWWFTSPLLEALG